MYDHTMEAQYMYIPINMHVDRTLLRLIVSIDRIMFAMAT